MPNPSIFQPLIEKLLVTRENSYQAPIHENKLLESALSTLHDFVALTPEDSIENLQKKSLDFIETYSVLTHEKIAVIFIYVQTIKAQNQWDDLEKKQIVFNVFHDFHPRVIFPDQQFHRHLSPIYLSQIFYTIIQNYPLMMVENQRQLIRVYVLFAYRLVEMDEGSLCAKEKLNTALNLFFKAIEDLIQSETFKENYSPIRILNHLGLLTLICKINNPEQINQLFNLLIVLKRHSNRHIDELCALYPKHLLNFRPLSVNDDSMDYLIELHLQLMNMQLSHNRHINVFNSLSQLLQHDDYALYFINKHNISPLFARAVHPPRIKSGLRSLMFHQNELNENYVRPQIIKDYFAQIEQNPIECISLELIQLIQTPSTAYVMEQLYALLTIKMILGYCEDGYLHLSSYQLKEKIQEFSLLYHELGFNDERKVFVEEISELMDSFQEADEEAPEIDHENIQVVMLD